MYPHPHPTPPPTQTLSLGKTLFDQYISSPFRNFVLTTGLLFSAYPSLRTVITPETTTLYFHNLIFSKNTS